MRNPITDTMTRMFREIETLKEENVQLRQALDNALGKESSLQKKLEDDWLVDAETDDAGIMKDPASGFTNER